MADLRVCCLLIDHKQKAAFGGVFSVKVPPGAYVSDLTTKIKEKRPDVLEHVDPAMLIVRRCTNLKLLAGLDSDRDRAQLEMDLSNVDLTDETKAEGLGAGRKITTLGLSDGEILLVQLIEVPNEKGMVLAQLDEATVRDPDLDEQVEKYKNEVLELPRKSLGGSDGQKSNGRNDIRPNRLLKTDRTSGKGKKRGNSGQDGRASSSKKRVRRPDAVTNNAVPIIPSRLTRSASRQLMSHNTSKTDKSSTLVVRIAGVKCLGPDLERSALFELVPGVQFSSFPSTAEVPFLQVVGGKGIGATGTLYKAQLRKTEDGTKHFYALKVVDGLRPGRGHVNFCADLYNEYSNYSLLQVAKRDKHLEIKYDNHSISDDDVVRCEPLKESWVIPEGGNKDELLTSLTLFHSLGLNHRDCDEKNIVFYSKTKLFKFIDLCDAVWHDCRGFCDCEEMFVRWEILNDGSMTSVNPLEFQRRVMDKYGMEFCNLRKVLAWDGLVNVYDLGKCLREFADGYEESRKEVKVNFLGYN
ncbi:hypothetical protein ACEPAG_8888 [Sanghuangporus baumii]